MTKAELPQTDSIRELARFWDTHDLTDFEDQLEEVTAPVFERSAILSVELPASAAESIRRTAASRGVRDTELVRQWVLERAAAA